VRGIARARAEWTQAHRSLLTGLSRVRRRPTVDALAGANGWFFQDLDVDRADAEQLCKETLASLGHASPPEGSIHYLAFAALRCSGFEPANILELGTFRAEASEYLAVLFPDAVVHTVDLPTDDPIVAAFGMDSAGMSERGRRLDRSNIVAHQTNTMFLAELDLPSMDLVWLDAGHHFPEVAWDHAYCLHRLRPGGWLLSDDIRLPDNPLYRRRRGALDAHQVIRYWNDRRTDQFRLLIKREDPDVMMVDPKHIAVLHRRG
jgi:predicted O-methyltransferase YrrM